MEEHRPAARADEPLHRHAPAVRAELIAALAVARAIGRRRGGRTAGRLRRGRARGPSPSANVMAPVVLVDRQPLHLRAASSVRTSIVSASGSTSTTKSPARTIAGAAARRDAQSGRRPRAHRRAIRRPGPGARSRWTRARRRWTRESCARRSKRPQSRPACRRRRSAPPAHRRVRRPLPPRRPRGRPVSAGRGARGAARWTSCYRATPNVKTVFERYVWPGRRIVDGKFGVVGRIGEVLRLEAEAEPAAVDVSPCAREACRRGSCRSRTECPAPSSRRRACGPSSVRRRARRGGARRPAPFSTQLWS